MTDNMDQQMSLKKQFLQCAGCGQEYNDSDHSARVLTCRHVYCMQCLHTENQCQRCGTTYSLGQGVDAPPVDSRIAVIAELIHRIIGESTGSSSEQAPSTSPEQVHVSVDSCDFCGENPQQFSCKECKSKMCEACKSQLHIGKTFKKHHVTRIDTADDAGTSQEKKAAARTCSKRGHEDFPLDMFCLGQDCKTLICTECASVHDSASHRVVNLELANMELRNDTKDVMSRLKLSADQEDNTDKTNMCELLSHTLDITDSVEFLQYGPVCISLAEDMDSDVSSDDLEEFLSSAIPKGWDEDTVMETEDQEPGMFRCIHVGLENVWWLQPTTVHAWLFYNK